MGEDGAGNVDPAAQGGVVLEQQNAAEEYVP